MLLDKYTKEEFDNLSNKEQRISIAKDVLENLESRRIISSPGLYMASQAGAGFSNNYGPSFDLKTAIEENERCHVCAIGAMTLSVVEAYNNISVEECERDVTKPLRSYFDIEELALLEVLFEGSDNGILSDENLFESELEEDDDDHDYDSYRYHSLKTGSVISSEDVEMAKSMRKALTNKFSAEIQKTNTNEPLDSFMLRHIMMNIIKNDGRFVVEV